MSKFIDLVYALAWWAYQKLHSFLGVTNPVVYKDIPEMQETLASLVAENDELKAELVSAKAENTLVFSKLLVPTGPNRPNNNRKLTSTEVQEIRDAYRGGISQASLADIFDVNRATISRIVRNQYHKTQEFKNG